jgi:nucleoside-diphosphate-sugar epimerase
MTENNKAKENPLVAVTGSTGLIGARVMTELANDYTVVGLDVNEPVQLPEGASWRECDLTSDESVEQVLAAVREEFGGHIASVVHLAAYYDFSGEPSPLYEQLTVEGTRRMITGLQRFESVEQFIFSSSLLVMQPVDDDDGKLTERSPTRGEWDYPKSKLRTERLLRDTHGDIPVVILRLAGAYDENCHSLPISQQIRRIYEKQAESFVFPGDADHGQPFVHLDDIATCLRATIERRNELDKFETFLIAEKDVMSYRELQESIGELVHGKLWPTLRIPKAVAKAGAKAMEQFSSGEDFIKPWMIDLADDNYPVETKRARERLGWIPQHRIPKAVPRQSNGAILIWRGFHQALDD